MSTLFFLAVGTPSGPDGTADLSAVESAAQSVAEALTGPAIVVNKSTAPVGTARRILELVERHSTHPVSVVSNPEFLKEGSAVDDFQRPDRVVIGADDADAGAIVAELHKPFVRNLRPILMMSVAAAELTKYAANACLSARISFINEIAELCEALQVDINEVRRGMGSDARIGQHFLYPGVGYGGSCFPKDVQALVAMAQTADVSCDLLRAVHQRNVRQRDLLIARVKARLGDDLSGRRLAVWGVSFKPKTDDIREAPSVTVIDALLRAGARISAYDPTALPNLRRAFGSAVEYAPDAYAALGGADALLVMTEWNEFRSPDFPRLRADMRRPLIFDGRNLYELETMRRRGFEYYSVGRPPVIPPEARPSPE